MGKYNPNISINYQRGDIDSYESVKVTYNFNKNSKAFYSGDFIKDWYDATKFKISLDKHDFQFENSPTVEQFISDGAPFEMVHLNFVHTLNGVFEYLSLHPRDTWPKGSAFFIREGTTPTWGELREICDDEPELV